MNIVLTPVEARVLGSLIEKQIARPDSYPLSLNALRAACNQKSNRSPVMHVDEKTIVRALDDLGEKQLARRVIISGVRVPKYRHDIQSTFELSSQELSVLCVLLLRGPQTAGEIRSRTVRLCVFHDLAEVEATLHGLMERDDGPFVVKLPRETGHREQRYTHLFCGEPRVEGASAIPSLEAATLEVQSENKRIAALEQEVARLWRELEELKRRFVAFTKQFE